MTILQTVPTPTAFFLGAIRGVTKKLVVREWILGGEPLPPRLARDLQEVRCCLCHVHQPRPLARLLERRV